jgi:transcriptional regulator with XRE-family HTH domain
MISCVAFICGVPSRQEEAVTSQKTKRVRNRNPKSVDKRDAEIGCVVRAQRHRLGLSQSDLGDQIGVTFQQVQKYENGTSRISASRLTRIAEALNVPPTFFVTQDTKPSVAASNKTWEFLATPGALRLVEAYNRLSRSSMRAALVELAEKIAKTKP